MWPRKHQRRGSRGDNDGGDEGSGDRSDGGGGGVGNGTAGGDIITVDILFVQCHCSDY